MSEGGTRRYMCTSYEYTDDNEHATAGLYELSRVGGGGEKKKNGLQRLAELASGKWVYTYLAVIA